MLSSKVRSGATSWESPCLSGRAPDGFSLREAIGSRSPASYSACDAWWRGLVGARYVGAAVQAPGARGEPLWWRTTLVWSY